MPFFQTMAKKPQSNSVETRKQSRPREREQEQLRVIYLALGIVAALVVVIFAFGYWKTTIAILDETIATVNGVPLTVRDYQLRARDDTQVILAQLQQIQSTLSQFDPSDQITRCFSNIINSNIPQNRQMVQVSGQALEDLIDDELVRQEAKKAQHYRDARGN